MRFSDSKAIKESQWFNVRNCIKLENNDSNLIRAHFYRVFIRFTISKSFVLHCTLKVIPESTNNVVSPKLTDNKNH